ncbi:hypothetical protein GQ457_13G013270 [Hibiscus cannabinus]
MENKSFALKWDSAAEGAHATHSSDTWLWHRRYGHFNMRALCELHKKNMVIDFPSISLSNDLCEPCKLGKQHRLPLPKEKVWRASEKLQLVHTDICRPHRTLSLGGNKYFILFIDDFTRMTWVYFLKEKLLIKVVQDKTPVEAWFGRKPSTKHLRVFGSICYAHIPAQKRSKLDAKAERGIFLGYDSQDKGYRIFNLDTEKIMIMSDELRNEDDESEEANNDNQTPPFTPIQPNDDSGESSNSQDATGPRDTCRSKEVVLTKLIASSGALLDDAITIGAEGFP